MTRISLDPDGMAWQPAHEVWPAYRIAGLDDAPAGDGGAGVFLKVLRRPGDGGGCWCALLRFRPPAGRAIRVTAVAASDEEVVVLSDGSGGRSATFSCNPEGLRHGNTFAADTTAFVHYHGEPDEVLRMELVEQAGATG